MPRQDLECSLETLKTSAFPQMDIRFYTSFIPYKNPKNETI